MRVLQLTAAVSVVEPWWYTKNTWLLSSKNTSQPSPPPPPAPENEPLGGATAVAVPVAICLPSAEAPLDTKAPVARTALTAAQPAVVVGAVELNVVPFVEYESVHPAGKVMSLALVSLTLVGSII